MYIKIELKLNYPEFEIIIINSLLALKVRVPEQGSSSYT